MEAIGYDQIAHIALLVAVLGFMWKLSRDVKSDGERTRAEVRKDMGEFRTEMKNDMDEFRTEMKKDMGVLRTEMKKDMGVLRTEMKKDMSVLRTDLKEDTRTLSRRIDILSHHVSTMAERVARIEGRLRMPGVVVVTEREEPAGIDA